MTDTLDQIIAEMRFAISHSRVVSHDNIATGYVIGWADRLSALSGARLESPRCVAADVVTDAMDDAEWIHVSDFERMLAVRIEAALNVKSVAADVVSEKDSIEKIVADMRAQPFSKVSMDIVDTWGYRLIELSRACKGEG